MAKTVSFTLENPITSLRKMVAKRAISKSEKRIAKEQEKIQKLQNKFFKSSEQKSSDEVTEVTKESKTFEEKMKTLDNRIVFGETSSGNLYAKYGRIDEAIEKIESLEKQPKCVKISVVPFGDRKGRDTLFVNVTKKFKGTPLNKKHAKDLLERLGYEVENLA